MKIEQKEINQIYYNPSLKVSNTSFFKDAEWELEGADKKIKFNVFEERPEMEEVIRQYLLYEYVSNSGNSVLRTYEGIKSFSRFLSEKFPTIKSFDQINRMIIVTYFNHILSFKYKKGSTNYNEEGIHYSTTSVIHNTRFLKEIYNEGIKKNLINKNKEFALEVEQLYNSIILSNPRIAKHNSKRTTKNEYSKETITKIVTSAYNDEDLYARAIIVTQSQNGPRIEEVLGLEEDCIRIVSGSPRLSYDTKKTKKGTVKVEKPTNEAVVRVLTDLIEFTEQFRREHNTKKIFITRQSVKSGIPKGKERIPRNRKQLEEHLKHKGTYNLITKGNVNRDFIKPLIARWDIRENGELIEYTSHYNRHFFVNLAWTENMSINSIKGMLEHDSLEMTAAYTTTVENAMRQKFKEMISDPNNMVGVNVGKYKDELNKANIFEGKTEAQLEAIIGVMNVQVLSNGACMHHPLKAEQRLQKCKPGCHKCDRFITHKAYLPVHKLRVARLEQIMQNALELNNLVWYEKNKAEKEYIENHFIKPYETMQGGD